MSFLKKNLAKLFEPRYEVLCWNGREESFTAQGLYERVLRDSRSDYNWIASATDLVNVCNHPSFPEEYSVKIKTIILNCFANLELQKEYSGRRKLTDNAAVYSCYHSLPSANPDVKKVKDKYLANIITGITKYDKYEVRFPIHPGDTYKQKVNEWEKAKFDEYVSAVNLDFDQLRDYLFTDFENMVRTAEKEGLFEKEDEEFFSKMQENFQNFSFLLDLKGIE